MVLEKGKRSVRINIFNIFYVQNDTIDGAFVIKKKSNIDLTRFTFELTISNFLFQKR